jgi:hypothetical protein
MEAKGLDQGFAEQEAFFEADESLPTDGQIVAMNRLLFLFLILFGFTSTLRTLFAFSGISGEMAHGALGMVLVALLLLLLISWVVVLVLPRKE